MPKNINEDLLLAESRLREFRTTLAKDEVLLTDARIHIEDLTRQRDEYARRAMTAGPPFFFKGWGEWAPPEVVGNLAESPLIAVPHGKKRILAYGEDMIRVGKKLSGRLLDGVEHNERPW